MGNPLARAEFLSSLVVASLILVATFAILPVMTVHAQSGTSQLTITSQNTSGATITGYYTVLNYSGSVQQTGFTLTFTVSNGESYSVQVDNYGSCSFVHWADTGSQVSSRVVNISSDTTYAAV